MSFFIHQSRLKPTYYVFTLEKDDFSSIPEGVLEELGKLRFLRKARDKGDETISLSAKYSEIVQNITSRGYHVLEIIGR